jgi:hypothetical protein
VGVVCDQLFSILVVELPHSRQPAFPVVGLQGGNRGHQPRAVNPEGLMSQGDEDEVGLLLVGGHSTSYGPAALPSLSRGRCADDQVCDERRRPPRVSGLGRRVVVSPGAVAHYFRQSVLIDVRELLPVIQAPTLVLQRAHDQIARPELGRYLADHIPDATYVELDGADHIWFTENADEVVDEIQEFLTGTRASPDPDRKLATVFFTDIVDSTARAAEVGDTRWRALLDEHDSIVRQELARFGGHEVTTPVTVSSPPSTGQVAPSAAPALSMMLWLASALRSGSACTPERWRYEENRSVGSPCTSAPE